MAPSDQKPEVIPLNVNYALEIDGVQLGVFERVWGGDLEIDVIQHHVVYENGSFETLNIPGPSKVQPLTLECGYGNSAAIYQWYQQVQRGDIFGARKNGTITLSAFVKGKYEPAVYWHLINAWPSKVSGMELSQETMTQRVRFSVTLTVEAIEREYVL